jgi:hypothetical protein
MSDNLNSSNVFDRPGSHWNWENLIQYARQRTGLHPGQAHYWADALEFIRSQLGDGFLRAMKVSHPLSNLIINFSPWHIERTIQYADILRDLRQHDPGYPAFLKKLSSPVDAKNEMMDFLRIAEILRAPGLLVRFPKPKPNQKNPDLQIVDPDSDQVVFGEVSRLDDSGARAAQKESYDELAPIIHGYLRNPLYSARQTAVPPAGYSDTLPLVLHRLQQEAENQRGHAHHKDDFLEIDVFPLDDQAMLDSWLDDHKDRRKGFNGISLNFNDTHRISDRKIKTEADHFSPSQLGLIVIPVTIFNFMHQGALECTRVIKYRLATYPNIVGVYLYTEIIESHVSLITDKGYARKQLNGPMTKYSLYVENDVSTQIHPSIQQKMRAALLQHEKFILMKI